MSSQNYTFFWISKIMHTFFWILSHFIGVLLLKFQPVAMRPKTAPRVYPRAQLVSNDST